MSDPSMDTRNKSGSPSDRKVSTAQAAATGAGAASTIGFSDWLSQCYQAGHWHGVAPTSSSSKWAHRILLLPVALWLGAC